MEENTNLSRENVVEAEKPNETETETKLSRREALEVGLAVVKEKEEAKAADSPTTEVPAPAAAAVEAKPTTLEPPSEWTKEEKEDFKNASRKSQEAALRLEGSRSGKLKEISSRENQLRDQAKEFQDLTELRAALTPYLKATGEKLPTDVALKKALKMWGEFEHAEDPKLAAAEYLKAKGIDVPEGFLEKKDKTPLQVDPKTIKDEVKAEIAAEQQQAWLAQERANASLELETAVNEAGLPRYPQFSNTEDGIRLASKMGQLVAGNLHDSVGFYAYCKARIPEAELSQRKILEEAYKWFGGTVDDTPGKKAPDKKHLEKSNRAASSTPGRGSGNGFIQPPKKLSRREWLAQAIERAKEENH